jgi:hypothetical protein
MRLGVERRQRADHVLERGRQRKVGAGERAEPVLGLNEHRAGGLGGEGGLANTVHPVDGHDRRLGVRSTDELVERDGHYWAPWDE